MATKGVANGSSPVPRDQVNRAAEALKAFSAKENPLNIDDDAGIYLGFRRANVSLKALAHPKFLEVPNPVFPPASKVCLFVKDIKPEDKANKQIYAELKLTLDKVMPYSSLKKKYSAYDSLRQLASRFDMFFVDERLLVAAYHILGRQFAKKVHKPIPISVEGKSPKEILQHIDYIKRCAVYIPANGPTASIKIGRVGFTTKQITDNIMTTLGVVESKLESWANLVHIYIKTPTSPSLTIHQVLPAIDATTTMPLVKEKPNRLIDDDEYKKKEKAREARAKNEKEISKRESRQEPNER